MTIQKPTDCFSINKKFWKFLGISSSVQSKFYSWYSKMFILVFVIMYDTLITINFFYLPRDLDHFIEEMIFYFMELSVVAKVMTYIVMQRKITEILDVLDSQMFQPATEEGVRIIGKAMKFNVKYWKIVAIVSYFSHSVHIVSPLLAYLFLKVPLVLPVCSYSFLAESIKEMFMYPLYLYQTLGMHMHMLYCIHIDTFFVGLMIFTIAQFEILEVNLSTITNIPRVRANGTDSIDSSTELRYIEELNKSVTHFRAVIKFRDLIEEVFSVTLFVQFSMASSIICVCLFRFTLPAPIQYYMFLSTYLFIMTVLIIVPCFFGTRIMTKSCLLSQAIYDCDWTPRSRRFKSTMRLLVERANRPLSITGWKMFPLSLNTFTSIMNTAYSFFTLLRNVQTREH